MSSNNESPVDVASHDLEAAKPRSSSLPSSAFLEAAALLTIWSILVINEGAIRVIDQNPSVDLTAGGRPAKMLPFLGGLFEVFFGLLGLALGASAFILKWYSTGVTKLSMVIQTILGYYVFVIYVFVVPGFRGADITEPSLPGLSVGESKFIVALGVLTSFHFCLALQGGQFVFMARLICAATGDNFLMQRTGNRMRAIFWNANLAFSGLWTLITGAIVNSKVGGGKIDMPFFSPPNVGRLSGFTIFTGLMILLWGIVGIAMAITHMAPAAYFVGTGVVYFFGLLNYGILQFGLLNAPPSGPVALHNGLVFMVVFLGPYFVHLSAKEAVESA